MESSKENYNVKGSEKSVKDIFYWETVFENQLNGYEKMIDYKIKKMRELEQIELSQLSKNQFIMLRLIKREIELLVGFLSIMEHLKDSYLIVTMSNATILWKYWADNQDLLKRVRRLEEENDFWINYCYRLVQDRKGGITT